MERQRRPLQPYPPLREVELRLADAPQHQLRRRLPGLVRLDLSLAHSQNHHPPEEEQLLQQRVKDRQRQTPLNPQLAMQWLKQELDDHPGQTFWARVLHHIVEHTQRLLSADPSISRDLHATSQNIFRRNKIRYIFPRIPNKHVTLINDSLTNTLRWRTIVQNIHFISL